MSSDKEVTMRGEVGNMSDTNRFENAQTQESPPPPVPDISPTVPAQVDRYVIIEQIGSGGIGVVYTAYDPKLDRKIALKVLRPERENANERARLIREAKAMAQLSHPNVVPVFDAGATDSEVFIAMEYVRGGTLRRWLETRSAKAHEILDVYTKAARGLEAAHKRGLVHRDFKPDNVLVTEDGQVKVSDFGLVQSVEEFQDTPDSAAHIDVAAPTVAGRQKIALTQTGALLGTPAYMAPEQISGSEVGAAADQWAFCVSLYEAIYRKRPFPGASIYEILNNQSTRDADLSAPQVPIPLRVRSALARGLRFSPSERWPSMTELIHEMEPRRGRAPVFWASLAIATVTPIALVFGPLSVGDTDPCQGTKTLSQSVWNTERESEVQAAILGTGETYAKAISSSIETFSDDLAESVDLQHTEACKAYHGGEISSDLYDRRVQCLKKRLENLDTILLSFMVDTTESMSRHVEQMSRAIPADICKDTDYLMSLVPPPTDPVIADNVTRIRKKFRDARQIQDPKERLRQIRELTKESQKVGYPALEAEILRFEGELAFEIEGLEEASEALKNAYFIAESASYDDVKVQSAVGLGFIFTNVGKLENAELWHRHALSIVKRHGNGSALEAWVNLRYGDYLRTAARYEEGVDMISRALSIYDRVDNRESARRADALVWRGIARMEGGLEGARDDLEKGIELYIEATSEGHPFLCDKLQGLGGLYVTKEMYSEAKRTFQRAMGACIEEETGLGTLYQNLATLADKIGPLDDLERYSKMAIETKAARVGRRAPSVALSLINLGVAQQESGRLDDAEISFGEALDILKEALGDSHPATGAALDGLATVARDRGDGSESFRLYSTSKSIIDNAIPGPHPMKLYPLCGIAEALVLQGKKEEATSGFEEVLRAVEATPNVDIEGRALAGMARSLLTAEPERAREYAGRAIQVYGQYPDRYQARMRKLREDFPRL